MAGSRQSVLQLVLLLLQLVLLVQLLSLLCQLVLLWQLLLLWQLSPVRWWRPAWLPRAVAGLGGPVVQGPLVSRGVEAVAAL